MEKEYNKIMNIFQKLTKENRNRDLFLLETLMTKWRDEQRILRIHKEQTKQLKENVKIAEINVYKLLSDLGR